MIEEQLLNRDVVSTDATLYVVMQKKAINALKEIWALKLFAGTLIHDHESALYHFETEPSECNVYPIRYLRTNTEETGNTYMVNINDKAINRYT